jgi:hypothetical protein
MACEAPPITPSCNDFASAKRTGSDTLHLLHDHLDLDLPVPACSDRTVPDHMSLYTWKTTIPHMERPTRYRDHDRSATHELVKPLLSSETRRESCVEDALLYTPLVRTGT